MKRSGPPWGEPLLRAFGPPGAARRLHSSPRSRVWRVRLGSGPAVVKQAVGDGAGERFARELTALSVAALHAAASGGPAVVPRVLGSDDGDLVLVLQDVDGPAGRPSAEWAVVWAASLARLHLAGAVVAPGSGSLPRASGPGPADVEAFLRFAAAAGVDGGLAAVAARELDGVLERLAVTTRSGPALLHGDPCPDNALSTGTGTVFVDLEAAALGDPVTELAYLRVGFPTCWCFDALPRDAVARAETAYRQVWAAGSGTPVAGDLADACVGWLLRGDALVERALRDGTDHLARAAAKDWRWGTATARQRLAHRLTVVADLAAGRPDLSGVAALARAVGRSPGLGAFRAP